MNANGLQIGDVAGLEAQNFIKITELGISTSLS